MNDYKELIHSLDMAGFWLSGHSEERSNLYFQAADVIEQLVKERDAAVKELGEFIEEAQSRLGEWRGAK